MTGIGRTEVKGYCDALVRMRRGNGSVVHVWLTDAAYIPNMASNLISTGTLYDRSIEVFKERVDALPRAGQVT